MKLLVGIGIAVVMVLCLGQPSAGQDEQSFDPNTCASSESNGLAGKTAMSAVDEGDGFASQEQSGFVDSGINPFMHRIAVYQCDANRAAYLDYFLDPEYDNRFSVDDAADFMKKVRADDSIHDLTRLRVAAVEAGFQWVGFVDLNRVDTLRDMFSPACVCAALERGTLLQPTSLE